THRHVAKSATAVPGRTRPAWRGPPIDPRKSCVRPSTRAKSAQPDRGPSSRWLPAPLAVVSESMRNVLVVDDNQHFAENIAEILGMRGFAAAIATSAEEALPIALAEAPELLVTDFRLPGMTGAERVRKARERLLGVRAVVISAYTDDNTVAAARDAGADFLPKPVDFGALSRILAAA